MNRLAGVCAASVAAAALVGCSTSSQLTAATSVHAATTTVSPAPPAATFSTAVAAGVDTACEHAPISAQQLVGDWTEEGDTTVTTLVGDYTVKSSAGSQTGSWSYKPWAATPGKSSMPPGEDQQCVLWLHYQTPPPAMDLVYVPLKATDKSLELSYVGRGNTLHWVRPHPAT